MSKKGRIVGIGGVFFKSQDPKKLSNWYAEHMGMVPNEYGSLIEFRKASNPEEPGYLQWGPFDKETEYFQPSTKEFMFNYRVENIEALVEHCKENGITVCDEIEEYSYGKFVHIMDPEGNKIELWEPIDEVFTEMNKGKTTKE